MITHDESSGHRCSIRYSYQILLNKIYYFCVDRGFSRLSAIPLSLLTRTINKKKNAKRILCFGSLAALHDINTIVEKSNRFQYLFLPRFYFGYVLKKNIQDPAINASNYHVDSRYVEGRERTYRFLYAMFKLLRVLLRFNAVMTSNFGYIEQQEIMRVAQECGVPVIVMYKEGLATDQTLNKIAENYQTRKVQCDLFLCYNDNISRILLQHKISGLTRQNIRTTGFPRLDLYQDVKGSTDSNQLTLFSYLAEDKFGFLVDDPETMALLKERTFLFHTFVIRYAVENPGTKVVIKTKMSVRDISYVEKIVDEYLDGGSFPENLVVTNEGNAMDYILESRCVLGCNSTVLFEALLAGKIIGLPDFNGLFNNSSWDLFEGYENLLSYISSYDDVHDLFHSPREYSEDEKECMDQLFRKYIYRADGRASVRVEEYISQIV